MMQFLMTGAWERPKPPPWELVFPITWQESIVMFEFDEQMAPPTFGALFRLKRHLETTASEPSMQ
jgi:hypothetical protein